MSNSLLTTKVNTRWNDINRPLHNNFKSCIIPHSDSFTMLLYGTTTQHPLSFVSQALQVQQPIKNATSDSIV